MRGITSLHGTGPSVASQTVPGYRFAFPPAGRNKRPSPTDCLSQCDEWRITSLAEASRCVASVDLITRVL
jgi:hypothetical protein